MLNSEHGPEAGPHEVEAVVRAGPRGAIALAGLSTLVVLALWLAFYLFVFVPRGGA